MTLLIGLAVIAGATIVLTRVRRRSKSAQRHQRSTGHNQHFAYRAVSIRTGTRPCDAASTLKRARFLLGKTPVLPLLSCDRERCDCTYGHHPDRRDPGERRGFQPFDLQMCKRTDGPDHRHNRGRRRIDYA